MKRAVVTITTGDLYTALAKVTHPRIKAYAEKIGAEFIVLDDIGDNMLPHYLKLKLNSICREYERVLYIDTDILVREDAPDIFDVVPANELGIFEEGQFADRIPGMIQYLEKHGVDPKVYDKCYYNTGVMVLSPEHANLFLPPVHQEDHFKEQTYLNLLFCLFKPKLHKLHYKWNRMSLMDKITGEERFNSYFMHYAGLADYMGKDQFLDLLAKDIDVWKDAAPKYEFRKNVAVNIEGGMGDQICAEPALRFVVESLYKGDNIVAITDFPEVFQHLDITIHKRGTPFKTDKGFTELFSLRNPDHPSWEYMSHPLCHGVDFSALQMTRSTLAKDRKRIRIAVDVNALAALEAEYNNLRNLVLVHPGRGWPSKTIPSDCWQSYIDKLLDHGFRVGVIGKHLSDEQGIVPVKTHRSNCIDLVNKLSLPKLIALISEARCLITNDSAPVHIAGAFDNWIGLIATCKRPDCILPYRGEHRDVFYKAEALEEYKLYEDYNAQPTQVYGATIDKCTDEQIRAAAPSADKVLAFAQKCFKEKFTI